MTNLGQRATITAANEANVNDVFGTKVIILVTGSETNNAYCTYQVTVPAGAGSPPHVHSQEDEAFYVLEGEFEFMCGDQTVTAKPGTFLHLPNHVPHYFRNVGEAEGKLLGIASPAGHERFFEDVNALGPERYFIPEEAVAVCRKHGIELLMGE